MTSAPRAPSPEIASTWSEVRALYQHSRIYTAASILNRGASFLLIPIYTHFLDRTAYGSLGVITVTSEIIGASIGLKLASAMSRLYFDQPDPRERNEIVTSAILGALLLMALAIVPVGLLAGPLSRVVLGQPGMGATLFVGVVGLLLNTLFTFGLQYLQIRQRSGGFLVASVLRSVLYIGITAFLVAKLRWGLMGALWGLLIANGISSAALVLPLLARLGFRFSRPKFVTMARFGLPLMPGQMAEIAGSFAERYLIMLLRSLASAGVYFLALRLASLLNAMILAPFGQIFIIRRFQAYGAGSGDSEATRAFTYFFLLMTSAALGLSILAPEAVALVAPGSYREAIQVIPLMSLTQVILSLILVAELGIYYAKAPRHVTTATVSSLAIQVALGLVLIRVLGIVGAALAGAVAMACRLGITIRLARNLGSPKLEWRTVLVLLVAAAGWYGLSRTLPPELGWASAVRAGLLAGYPAAMLASPLFTGAERRALLDHLGGLVRLRRAR